MKNIKDYIGKKVVIQCANEEEWEAIKKLAGYTYDYRFEDSEYRILDIRNKSAWSCTSKEVLERDGYDVYPASDFLETKFIKGKWYKVKSVGNTYFKFDYIQNINEGYNKVFCIDRIWLGAYSKNESFCNIRAEESTVLLEDLSEIQEFLPDGHEDKINSTKLAVLITEDNKEYLSKFLKNHKDEYKGYKSDLITWDGISFDKFSFDKFYFHYPQIQEGVRNAPMVQTNYRRVTTEQFKQLTNKHGKTNNEQSSQNDDSISRRYGAETITSQFGRRGENLKTLYRGRGSQTFSVGISNRRRGKGLCIEPKRGKLIEVYSR